MGEKTFKNLDDITEDTITQPVIDTFEHLPSEYTHPQFDYFHSETKFIINQ